MEMPIQLDLTLEESTRLVHLLELFSDLETVYTKDAIHLKEKILSQLPDIDFQREEFLMVSGSSNS